MKQDSTASTPPRSRTASASSSPLKETFRVVAPLLLVGLGLAAFFTLRSLKEAPQRTIDEQSEPMVETVSVQPHGEGLNISIDGVVVPFREIDLSAEVSGRVAGKAEICQAGNYVAKGTPLFLIDARDYQLEVERIKGELAQADISIQELDVESSNTKSLLKLEREQLTLQHKELERQQTLAGKRIVTDSDLDKAKREELAAINAVLTLDNQLKLLQTRRFRLESARDLSQSQLDRAQLDLERTKVASPIDGVIIKEMVEEDSYVQKGTSLAKLEDTSAVEVRCNLRMDELYWLWAQDGRTREGAGATRDYQIPETPVTVRYELAGRRYQWSGTLSRFDGIGVDERTRTVPCLVMVSNPRDVSVEGEQTDGRLGPPALVRGMYVTVSIHAQPRMTLLEIPEQAVQPGNKVWQVADGRLQIRRIRVADSTPTGVLVYAEASGLQPGMRLVSSPLASATDGMAVRERAKE